MSFPNETSEYRAARDALLLSEIALRRQMEAVAAQLRALPPGGEVSEDYVFDAIGAGGVATGIRMSELFRGGDTLMMYHYMFPRHSRDERAGPTSGAMANVPVLHCAYRHVGRHDAALRRLGRQSRHRGASVHRTCHRFRARQGLEAYAAGFGGEQHISARLRGRRSGWRAGADHDRVQTLARWRRQAALGERIDS
jgi:hypothetical protein